MAAQGSDPAETNLQKKNLFFSFSGLAVSLQSVTHAETLIRKEEIINCILG